MTNPDDALEQARAAAAEARAEGAYSDDLGGFKVDAPERVSRERLLRWAMITPDPEQVYSTRALGAPITLFKKLLLRVLRQYHDQVLAQQSRFNAQVADRLTELEERVERLEAGTRPPEPKG